MDLENLTQFDKRLFKKYLGLYVQRQRQQLNISYEQWSHDAGLSLKQVKAIESGQGVLNQEVFDFLRTYLDLDPTELTHLGQITQVQSLMSLHKEIDEHYPG